MTRLLERKISISAVKRLAVPDVPIPGALSLEQAVVPNEESISAAIAEIVGIS